MDAGDRAGRRCGRHRGLCDACPLFPGKRYEDWVLSDPFGKSVEQVRPVRDEIGRRVQELLARDLLRFAQMLLDHGGGLLSPASVAAMTTDQLTPEQRSGPSAQVFLDGGGWGYGVGVLDGARGRRYGWGGGLGTLWYTWPDHALAAALLTQVLPPSTQLIGAFVTGVETALDG